MILSCTSCSTRYLVDPSALGEAGRRVRCARCGHSWFQDPPADEPADPASADTDDLAAEPDLPVAEPEPADSAAAAVAAPDDPPPRPRSERANLPALREPRKRRGWIGWVVLLLVLAGLGAGGVVYRDAVVAFWPPAIQLYRLAGLPVKLELGLDIRNVRRSQENSGGDDFLVVSGEVVNVAKIPRAVPRLRVVLYDENDAALFHWTATAQQASLRPGQSTPFSTRLRSPPAEARTLKVEFLVTP